MSRWAIVLTRLWRFLNVYFLKPFDAVNDTLSASLLARFDWSGEFVEIGSGDGVFSYIMHGGGFPIWFDRYLLTDLGRNDIFDTHRHNVIPQCDRLAFPSIDCAIDAKTSHVTKVLEIGFAKRAVCAAYERLPLASESVDAVFYYVPHGLKDHSQAILEAHRILRRGGRMLILRYDSRIRNAFLCHRLARLLRGRAGRYFTQLDNGRFHEITGLSKKPEDWDAFFLGHGFTVQRKQAGLSRFAWCFYDVQTRPLLKPLIRISNSLPLPFRTGLKLIWMVCWYPILLAFYFLFANDFVMFSRTSCFVAYELKKPGGTRGC